MASFRATDWIRVVVVVVGVYETVGTAGPGLPCERETFTQCGKQRRAARFELSKFD